MSGAASRAGADEDADRPVDPVRRVRPVRPVDRAGAGEAGTVVQRLRARLVETASAVACRLPEPLLVALAGAAGELWYRLDRARAERGRRNLRRVCEWLAARGSGPERARAAAEDPVALEALLRSAFRHQARYYLEVALAPRMTPAYIRARMRIETPDVVDAAFAAGGPVIFVGLHFGSLEFPAVFLADRSARVATAPMETIDDPPLQRWFARTRSSAGVRLVGLREARRELLAALRRGDPVGLIADRDVTGGGIEVPLFGHPAPLPVGPALLALDTGVPVFVAAVRRVRRGCYAARVERLGLPGPGSRRERVTAFLAAEAEAFERAIAVAPDQWWAVFFPIWPDLAGAVPVASAGTVPGAASR